MKWRMAIVAAMATLGFGVVADGCATAGPEISRVQTNLVDKSVFEGEWWYATTVVDVQGDEAATLGATGFAPFSGDMTSVDLGVDNGQSLQMARIKWVVDENYLYAYRSYELIAGGNDDGRSPSFRGQPLAAFPITAHVDVRRDYSTTTGEVTNVTIENTTDRQWYERQFARVDWSKNDVTPFYTDDLGLGKLFNLLRPEPVPFLFETGAHTDFPSSYQPQFVRVSEDPSYRFRDEWQTATDGDPVHYMSFVTQQVWSPGPNCLYYGGFCSSAQVTVRNSFLRVPTHHNYASDTETHQEFDRFGLFRAYQRTYVRGGQPLETIHQHCASDADCGSGGSCDMTTNYCQGGLTSDYGETDFLTFYRPRHNFFRDGLDESKPCIGDWECSGVYGTTADSPGAYCDRAARLCAKPTAARSVRQVAYTLSAHFPNYLVRSAFEVVGNWNEAFMRGWRASRGLAPPAGGRVDPQSRDPGEYCWRSADGQNSPEIGTDGKCAYKYDPFQPPAATGITGAPGVDSASPYDCHIVGPDEPMHPTAYSAYETTGANSVYGYHFEGNECMFLLKANACDADSTKACQDLGDIRYQFFNYVTNGAVQFGGVSIPLMDPTNGELITSNANLAAESVESIGTTAAHFFPVLRGEVSEESWFGSSELRGYFARAGRTEMPPALAVSGTDGYSVTAGPGRPGLPADIHGLIRAAAAAAAPRVAPLHGAEGRSLIMSDRMRSLAGRSQESQLLGVLGQDLVETSNLTSTLPVALGSATPAALAGANGDALAADPTVRAAISPFGDGLLSGMDMDAARETALSMRNYDPPFNPEAPLYNSRYWQYWANQFSAAAIGSGGSLGERNDEASIRMRQAYSRAVMHHEVGHSVGLRHNFGGTFDRNNYYDGYYNVNVDIPIPDAQSYDDPSKGGNGNGALDARELDKWQVDLRTARNARAARGAGNVMSNSIMDYHGDLSDMEGLGRYDIGTTMWNYFNQVEVYAGDPTQGVTDGIFRSDITPRQIVQYYRGGDACTTDADCPFSQDRFGGAASTAQPVLQRCVTNPRFSTVPSACGGGDRSCVCSAFDVDMADYTAAVAYIPQAAGGGPLGCTITTDCGPHGHCALPACTTDADCGTGHTCDMTSHTCADGPHSSGLCGATDRSVKYLFCPDDRVNDISWCNRFDAGESFEEAVDNWRRSYEEKYPGATYFRHYLGAGRGGGAPGGGARGSIIDAVKIFQHFFFRYFYEPGFQNSKGPLGIDDQFLASVDVMNWLVELASLPDVGSYGLQPDGQGGIWRQVSTTPDMTGPGIDFSLRPGNGYYMWSSYQTGLNGFFRRERAGVMYDKYIALLGMALRDWGLSYQIDERFFINFYDLFPVEMGEVFGGYIYDDPHVYAPRITTDTTGVTVHPVNIWRTSREQCGVSSREPCRGPITAVYSDLGHPVDHTSTEILRDWATILSLAQFPVFYDTSFEERLSIYKTGNGDGHTIPLTRPDGTPTCTYGAGGTAQACAPVATDPAAPTVFPACDTDTDCDPAIGRPLRLSSQFVCDLTVHVPGNPTRGACTTPDSIQYTRDDTRQTYVAVLLHPLITRPALRDEQLGFTLLRQIHDSQVRVNALELLCGAPPTFTCSAAEHDELVTRSAKLAADNSYLEYLIDIQRRYGVSSYL